MARRPICDLVPVWSPDRLGGSKPSTSATETRRRQTANVQLQMIVGYGETPFPIDFRSPAEFRAEVAETEATMRA